MGRKRKLITTSPNSLTEAEIKVLKFVAEGKGNEEIAEKLFIAKNTVRSHIKSIYRKIDILSPKYNRRLKLIVWAIKYFNEKEGDEKFGLGKFTWG